MNEDKGNPPLISSKRALIAQLWIFAIACLYPGMFALFALVSEPRILPRDRLPVVLEFAIPPLLLFATIRALRGDAWAIALSVTGQLTVTVLLLWGAVALARGPGEDIGAAFALGVLVPVLLLSACLSLWHIISTGRSYFLANDRNA